MGSPWRRLSQPRLPRRSDRRLEGQAPLSAHLLCTPGGAAPRPCEPALGPQAGEKARGSVTGHRQTHPWRHCLGLSTQLSWAPKNKRPAGS